MLQPREVLAAIATVLVTTAPAELQYDLRVDVPVTVGLGAWWLLSEFAFKHQLAPPRCRWCDRNALDDAGRALRAPVERQPAASLASDVVGVIATPVLMVGLDAAFTRFGGGTWRHAAVDALLVIEAMVASQALNQVVKFIAGRERPLVAQLPEDQKPLTKQPDDNNLSFFSGHTSYTFSLVAATATIVRARGYAHWWVVPAVGLPFAVTTALLRLAADKHYLTDVLTGAALGVLLGVGVPVLFHRPVQVGPVTARLTAGGRGVALVGEW